MSIDKEFLLNTPLIVLGLFLTVYWIYGHIKHKPLYGDYKPGMPGYDNFLKFVNNYWYLVAAIALTIFTGVKFVTDTLIVLNGPYSKAILITAPAFSVTLFTLIFWMIPYLLGKKRKIKP